MCPSCLLWFVGLLYRGLLLVVWGLTGLWVGLGWFVGREFSLCDELYWVGLGQSSGGFG